MLIYEYKLRTNTAQQKAIDAAILTTQFVRNKALRLWMDTRGTNTSALNQYSAQLAKQYPFAARLNSMARQAAAERAWLAISRFYKNCQDHKPGKKGYPRFQADRTIEHQPTDHMVGIDMGLKVFSMRKKAIKRLAKGYLRVSRQRKDFTAKAASALVKSSDLIAYEALQIANLVKNHHRGISCTRRSVPGSAREQARPLVEQNAWGEMNRCQPRRFALVSSPR